MWVEKKKDKKGNITYQYRERYTDPRTGKTKSHHDFSKNTKKNAARRELEIKSKDTDRLRRRETSRKFNQKRGRNTK